MPAVVRRTNPSTRLDSGPWKSVRTTTDPFDDVRDQLYDAKNVYNPDPPNAAGFYQRPGFQLLNNGDPLTTSVTPFRGQGVFYHTDLSTSVSYNFVVFDGKLFRVDSTLSLFEDVTPVGVTIDNSVLTRVYGTSFGDQFIITDGVNRPWLASDLDATPITGTEIQFNAANDPWSAFGPFVVYGGSAFCIVNEVDGISARTDIAWSAPGNAAAGWQQTDYDFRWTLEQTATDSLFALAATNVALYYFRARSVGAISGAVGPDLATTATHDAISLNIGTQMPQSIVQFGTMIYFTDALGRPYRMITGADPESIWLQMRAIVDASSVSFPGINRHVTTASFDPTLNLYIVAPFTTGATAQVAPPVEGYIFDARTAAYFGRFGIADGIQIETLGTFIDANGRGVLICLGSAVAPSGGNVATSGYVWAMNALQSDGSVGDFITTEDGTFITTEDGTFITTEGIGAANWTDNGVVPEIYATTGRMGYDIDTVLTVDRAVALVGTDDDVQVSASTAAVAQTVEGTPTPSTVQDGVAKLTAGFSGIQGRGVTVTTQPTEVNDQWSIQQMSVLATVSNAPPDEP